MSTYRELATKASEAERRGEFSDAAGFWNLAYEVASPVNQAWIIVRVDFCIAAKKNGWGVWA
ncbi:TPA: ANR family transcriptional regulator [Serratia fonticola]